MFDCVVVMEVERLHKLLQEDMISISVGSQLGNNNDSVISCSLLPRHGAAIRDFKSGAELWLLGISIYDFVMGLLL